MVFFSILLRVSSGDLSSYMLRVFVSAGDTIIDPSHCIDSFCLHIRIFLSLYKVGNVGNKGLRREEQNNFSKKKLSPVGIEPKTLGFPSWHILCYTLMPWQVLVEGYLTSLLLVHQDDSSEINRA